MAIPAVDIHRWTREDYERMAKAGLFRLLRLDESVSPLFSPASAFAVASFFPQRLRLG
jgi:hypothetical protein